MVEEGAGTLMWILGSPFVDLSAFALWKSSVEQQKFKGVNFK